MEWNKAQACNSSVNSSQTNALTCSFRTVSYVIVPSFPKLSANWCRAYNSCRKKAWLIHWSAILIWHARVWVTLTSVKSNWTFAIIRPSPCVCWLFGCELWILLAEAKACSFLSFSPLTLLSHHNCTNQWSLKSS